MPPTGQDSPHDKPAACPFCGSGRVAQAQAKAKPDTTTYSRCETCGQVWNAARLGHTHQSYGGR